MQRPGSAPINASTLLRFKRGNVLFISYPTGETWQLLDGSDPKGILVTNSSLFLPLYCGVLTAKGQRRLEARGRGDPLFLPFTVFVRMWTFDHEG